MRFLKARARRSGLPSVTRARAFASSMSPMQRPRGWADVPQPVAGADPARLRPSDFDRLPDHGTRWLRRLSRGGQRRPLVDTRRGQRGGQARSPGCRATVALGAVKLRGRDRRRVAPLSASWLISARGRVRPGHFAVLRQSPYVRVRGPCSRGSCSGVRPRRRPPLTVSTRVGLARANSRRSR
jgi:hypothetical protein